MKRNIVPLLGIAVVVAILSTGVFYGLFAGKLHSASADVAGTPILVASHDIERGKVLEAGDLRVTLVKEALAGTFSRPEQLVGATLIATARQNEPILEERVVTNTPAPGGAPGTVPKGLRAVSIRVSESDGIIGLLRPGAKVDIQAVQDRASGPELRTVLQNIEVVSVNSQVQPGAGNRGPVTIVTVLANPEDADVLAVADAGSRLRLALRNPLDEKTSPRRALSAGSVFQSAAAAEAPRIFAGYVPSTASLQVDVKLLRATEPAARDLESKLDRGDNREPATAVAAFRSGVDAREMIEKLAGTHEVSILAQRSFTASGGHPAWFRTGPAAGQLGLELFPETAQGGRVNLKIREEVVSQTAAGAETRRFEVGVPVQGSFLLSGILNEPGDRATLERLFPGNTWNGERLLILIASRESGEVAAHHDRGR